MNSHCFKLHRSYSISFDLSNVEEISGLNPKGRYLSLQKGKEIFCVVFTYSIKRARKIRRFHVAVVQRLLRNVQKIVKSCCFANLNLSPFCLSRCLSSPLLSSQNFATMVTWRHTFFSFFRQRGGHRFESRWSPDFFFFRLLLSNCLNWKIYCDDHSSLSLSSLLDFF